MLKKIFKVVGIVLGAGLLLVVSFVVWKLASYERDFTGVRLPNIHASQDPAVIAQGEYLVHSVAHCSACHGPASVVTHHQLPSNLQDMRGGYALRAGPFGTFYPSNITSDRETGIGAVSDGQLARVIRHGVGRNGRYAAFMGLVVGNMADEDLTAIISYLRTLPAIRNAVPDDEWGIVAKLISANFNPHPNRPIHYVPAGALSRERGEYLATGPAACSGCHTPTDPMNGFAPTGPLFSGEGHAEPDPTDSAYEFVVPNLTPDATGVMTGWDEDQFVARMRAGRVHAGSKMPWENFARMTENDLRSIYRYLHTLPATRHDVGTSRRHAG